jgi:ABC-type phosphate transport system auxiliary subunit
MTFSTSASPIKTHSNNTLTTATQGSSLADVLERVLDKGIVIAGDISVAIATTELLHIRIRLLISSVDKAREIGINWWEGDPYLHSQSQTLLAENQELSRRLQTLETELQTLKSLTQASAIENHDSNPNGKAHPKKPKNPRLKSEQVRE